MNEKLKTALVLEGGAMRGIFTCGVIDVLMEEGIIFDAGIGISAGAVFGCNYKSKQIGRGIRYNLNYCQDKRYCSIKSLRKTGDLYGVDFCYNKIPYELDKMDLETYKNNPMKFYVGITNVDSGASEIVECPTAEEYYMQYFRASASMPIVSRVVEIDGKRYLDGGISNSVPYKYMEDLGYNRNVIVLTQPKGYRKKKIKHRIIMKHYLKDLPKVWDLLLNRHINYNMQMDEIDDRENRGISLVIRPPKKLKIGKTEKNPKKLKEVYEIGRKEALKRLDEIKEFLKGCDDNA